MAYLSGTPALHFVLRVLLHFAGTSRPTARALIGDLENGTKRVEASKLVKNGQLVVVVFIVRAYDTMRGSHIYKMKMLHRTI